MFVNSHVLYIILIEFTFRDILHLNSMYIHISTVPSSSKCYLVRNHVVTYMYICIAINTLAAWYYCRVGHIMYAPIKIKIAVSGTRSN